MRLTPLFEVCCSVLNLLIFNSLRNNLQKDKKTVNAAGDILLKYFMFYREMIAHF